MEFKEKRIRCIDCGDVFEFDVGEQEFYYKKGFQDPKRCKDCRRARKEELRQSDR